MGRRLNIKGLEINELQSWLSTYNLPRFRGSQIYQWLYQKGACDWDELTVLPRELREEFKAQNVALGCLKLLAKERDPDGTAKFLFSLEDGDCVESVYIPEGERHTVCFSTQVGCGMGCRFCATGQLGLVRNLTAGEIIDQPLAIGRDANARINSLVAMGQGEPLANYDELLKAIRIINDPNGMGVGARHITISTCGLVPGIKRLAGENLQVNLAVSLHAADDRLRDELMPINRNYPVRAILDACRHYIGVTGRRVTFEYTLMAGVNDRDADLQQLAAVLKGMLCHVNLIPFNPVPGSRYRRSAPDRIRHFERGLRDEGIEVTVRRERGSGLTAACGQLRGKKLSDEYSTPVS